MLWQVQKCVNSLDLMVWLLKWCVLLAGRLSCGCIACSWYAWVAERPDAWRESSLLLSPSLSFSLLLSPSLSFSLLLSPSLSFSLLLSPSLSFSLLLSPSLSFSLLLSLSSLFLPLFSFLSLSFSFSPTLSLSVSQFRSLLVSLFLSLSLLVFGSLSLSLSRALLFTLYALFFTPLRPYPLYTLIPSHPYSLHRTYSYSHFLSLSLSLCLHCNLDTETTRIQVCSFWDTVIRGIQAIPSESFPTAKKCAKTSTSVAK